MKLCFSDILLIAFSKFVVIQMDAISVEVFSMHLPTTGQHFPLTHSFYTTLTQCLRAFCSSSCIYFCFTLASSPFAYCPWGFSCTYGCSVILYWRNECALYFFPCDFYVFSCEGWAERQLDWGEPLATWATDFWTATVWETCHLSLMERCFILHPSVTACRISPWIWSCFL